VVKQPRGRRSRPVPTHRNQHGELYATHPGPAAMPAAAGKATTRSVQQVRNTYGLQCRPQVHSTRGEGGALNDNNSTAATTNGDLHKASGAT